MPRLPPFEITLHICRYVASRRDRVNLKLALSFEHMYSNDPYASLPEIAIMEMLQSEYCTLTSANLPFNPGFRYLFLLDSRQWYYELLRVGSEPKFYEILIAQSIDEQMVPMLDQRILRSPVFFDDERKTIVIGASAPSDHPALKKVTVCMLDGDVVAIPTNVEHIRCLGDLRIWCPNKFATPRKGVYKDAFSGNVNLILGTNPWLNDHIRLPMGDSAINSCALIPGANPEGEIHGYTRRICLTTSRGFQVHSEHSPSNEGIEDIYIKHPAHKELSELWDRTEHFMDARLI